MCLAPDRDLATVLEDLIAAGAHQIGAAAGTFCAADPGWDLTAPTLHASADSGLRPSGSRDRDVSALLRELTLEHPRTLRVDDVRSGQDGAGATGPRARSLLSVPVLDCDAARLGVLLYTHPQPARFAAHHEAEAVAVASYAAAAIKNARQFLAATRGRERAEERARSLELLQEVTSRLATALTEDDALDGLCEVLYRGLGIERMGVYCIEDDGLMALRSRWPAGPPAESPAAEPSPPPPWRPQKARSLAHDAALTGELITVGNRAEYDSRYPGIIESLPAVQSAAAMPLKVSGKLFGALALTWTREIEFDDSHERLLCAIGEQFAGTLERCRLFAAEAEARADLRAHVAALTEASLTLQRALLPAAFPVSTHVDVAARYLPGAADAEVGGDWYDMVVGPGGVVTLVIGDVQGHCLAAAAVMGRVSTALRAYLLEGHPLNVALRRINPIVEQSDLLVTCALASFDPVTGQVVVVRAGHPLPVLSVDGRTFEITGETGGPPLGVPSEVAEWELATAFVPAGGRVMLFTDGLIETREQDTAERVAALVQAVTATRGLRPEAAADSILDRMLPRHGDDIALLVADFEPASAPAAATLTLTDHSQVSQARRLLRSQLAFWGLQGAEDAAALVLSEMVTNALVHAGGPARLTLEPCEHAVRISVSDPAAVMPVKRAPDDDDDHGRGVMLVEALAQRWAVEPSGAGKTVWAEVATSG